MSQVFFSWSGDLARQIADVFARWIPTILQTVTAFYSPDIEKGTRWGTEIANALEQCGSGLVFATPDNLKSQWLNFEAGAISKLGNARVYVLIFGLKKSDLTGPLAQFQASDFTHAEIRNVLNSINENGENVNKTTWQRAFDAIWPTIEAEVNTLLEEAMKKSEVPAPPSRSIESMMEEMLLIVRRIDSERPSEPSSSDVVGKKPSVIPVSDQISPSLVLSAFRSSIGACTDETEDLAGRWLESCNVLARRMISSDHKVVGFRILVRSDEEPPVNAQILLEKIQNTMRARFPTIIFPISVSTLDYSNTFFTL
jgi:hypothetical protein